MIGLVNDQRFGMCIHENRDIRSPGCPCFYSYATIKLRTGCGYSKAEKVFTYAP